MKKIFQHPQEPLNGKKYWRSLDQIVGTPEFQERLKREFPAGADEFESGGVSRRSFIKLMGASTALAGLSLSACRRPEKHLVPYTKSAEWQIPGKPLFYATSMPHRRGAQPLVVTTVDGRPTKIEGNPMHPASKGTTGTFAQSSILDMYDPDRSHIFRERGQESDATKFDEYLTKLSGELGTGEGLAFLLEENNSPTRERLRQAVLKKYPQASWAVYEPLGDDQLKLANTTAFGENVKVTPKFEDADVILALDSDFLSCEEGGVEAIRGFSDRRRVGKEAAKMNRLYVVENRYTITGGMADHRLRLSVSQIGAFVVALAEKIAVDPALGSALSKFSGGAKPAFDPRWLDEMAKDLMSAKGRSLVLVGARQPAWVQLLVAAINASLGNLGKTLVGTLATTAVGPVAGEKAPLSIAELAPLIQDKKITTLFIFGGNPVYNAPADLDWATLQKSIPSVIRVGLHEDESSNRVLWHVPGTHYLETWGDALATDGSYVSVQPMILPLFGGWSELDILARLLGQKKPEGPELVQDTFKLIAKPSDFKSAWNIFLHDGFLKGSAPANQELTFNASAAGTFIETNSTQEADGGIELVFTGDSKMDDGRFANNGWLQELPDPITKLTWDNAALVSVATASALGMDVKDHLGKQDFDTLSITIDEKRKIEIPVLIAPGHADNSITIPLGYGRVFNGNIAKGAGVDVYPLRTSSQPYFVVGSKNMVKRTGKQYRLAITQDHHSMEGRATVREATLETFKENPDFARTMSTDVELQRAGSFGNANLPSLYTHPPLDAPNQWGMAIDLNTCTGCNACVIACQSENNIPIVGKEQVVNGRSMHWIRNDRYYASVDEHDPDPEMLMQPMMCQQCENAPCETVCPVNATVHSTDGLNVMAYNRCIGTRYCANNCPFKVRRFNFFDYQQRPLDKLKLGPLTEKGSPDTLKMQKNPNVTVRMRGVMEKCTFCVQRIQEAKIAQKVKAGASDDVRVPTDSFQVACQQACPAEAIVFGDIKDPESKVSKLKEQERNYRLLEYLNVSTRVSYLARLRNPNPAMPDASKSAEFEKGLIHHEEKKGANVSSGGEA